MLEAFDLTGSCRDAGELAGVSHHTVARYVQARNAGDLSGRPAARPPMSSWPRSRSGSNARIHLHEGTLQVAAVPLLRDEGLSDL
jgi:hypothetical protein